MNLENIDKKNKRKPAVDLSTMVFGKVPPQSVDTEKAILGAITLELNAFDLAAEILQPECFYLEAHQRIYRAMVTLNGKRKPIDLLTLTAELLAAGDLETVGGYYGITKLQDGVVSSANTAAHCRIIYEKYVKRELIRIGGEMVGSGFADETDAFDALEESERKLSLLAVAHTNKPFETLGEVAARAVAEIYAAQQSKEEITGVPSGLPILDAITQGWQPTNLIIIAARPGVGKSALAGNLAINAATSPERKTPVGLFSLEMSSIQWVFRMLSGSTHVPMYDMKRGRIDDMQMKKLQQAAMIDYPNIPVFFDDTPGLDIHTFKRKSRVLVSRYKVGLIIADYLQLMSGKRLPGENREQEIARISRELKQLAKELHIPIIALAQLSRQGEVGEPKLGHLRESGAIEQDADDVIFLSPVEDEAIMQDASLKDSLLLIIAKHRNGILEKLPVKFVKSIQKLMTEDAYDRFITGRLPSTGNWRPVNENKLPYKD